MGEMGLSGWRNGTHLGAPLGLSHHLCTHTHTTPQHRKNAKCDTCVGETKGRERARANKKHEKRVEETPFFKTNGGGDAIF